MPLPMSLAKLTLASALLALCAPAALCQVYPAITTLGRNADTIVLAAVEQILEPGGRGGTPNLTIQLRVERIIKGMPEGLIVATTPAASERGQGPTKYPRATVGETGLWFLTATGANYRILPRRTSSYEFRELFLPVSGPPTGATLDDQLLAYLVRWYRSTGDLLPFYSTYEQWNGKEPAREQMVAALEPLITSASANEHVIGLAAAIQVESYETLRIVLKELPTLRSNPRFSLIWDAMSGYPTGRPKDPGWIEPIRQLVALHTDVPGLDAAAVGALWRVHTKEIWPVMADLLDSKDQLGAASIAARCFAVYAAGVDMRPETQAYMPAMKSTATPAELIVFWREWWMEHKERLGYQ